MKKIFIIALTVLTIPNVIGQKLTAEDHLKYWYYRYRLTEEFVITGEAEELCVPSGLSLPAGQAKHISETNYNLKLSWRENPGQHLGRYIGMLALELKLLYLEGGNYERTQEELYFAMKAYERIDYNCECLYHPKYNEGILNGLFGRDDVPGNFMFDSVYGGLHEKWREKNSYNRWIESVYDNSRRDGADSLTDNNYPSGEEWQGLLTGFALVVKSLADCPVDVVIYNGYRFIDEAILHTQRYMDRLKANDWIELLTTDQPYHYSGEGKKYQTLFGLAKAADYVCDGDRNYAVALSIDPERHYSDQFEYHDPIADVPLIAWYLALNLTLNPLTFLEDLYTEGLPWEYRYQNFAWHMFGNPRSELIGMDDMGWLLNYFFTHEVCLAPPLCSSLFGDLVERGHLHAASTPYSLAAIGNSWRDMRLGGGGENITFESLVEYTEGLEWDFLPLLNLYLHDKNNEGATNVRDNLVEYLSIAPSRGPHYLPLYDPPSEGVRGWRYNYKWGGSWRKSFDGKEPELGELGANFPGIDYMIAYNLLRLECIQKGIESDYFETNYTDEPGRAHSVYSGSNSTVLYKYGNLIADDIDITGDIHIISDNSITLSGEMNIGVGQSLSIQVVPKLTLPMVETLVNTQ